MKLINKQNIFHKLFFLIVAFIVIFLSINANASYNEVKQEVEKTTNQYIKNSILIGEGELKFFGRKIYDIFLYSNKEFNNQNRFNQSSANLAITEYSELAIAIKYNQNFSKKFLVEKTVDEILRFKSLTQQQKLEYKLAFNRTFQDIKKGDIKIALKIDSNNLLIFHNSKFIEKINNPLIIKDFMEIWLGEKARFPDLRDKLINKINFSKF